jgi:hypothetical protein
MKIEIDDDAPPLIVRALEHYGAYLKASNRDDSRYQALAETFKKKSVSSEDGTTEPAKRRRRA